eukprot:CAMPEP_0114368084 /NCGR_PEP_ID=MMETSP0101-20121206/30555_1 /TAXON_ID=38822 ORGANISM="Pteridomonas danica, Strain PT" /NCGR_SAMPLE_ID=MMETSP0101 /ASSEMBLY_ACC=CAM_ASM_000211 /LENGTH=50 /DNA_ID=CAMNT_0001518057 /DNA_START=1 /DNA_END=150 /DNA_ORIENTATION=+
MTRPSMVPITIIESPKGHIQVHKEDNSSEQLSITFDDVDDKEEAEVGADW